jgi:hypothetical protein
VASANDIAQLTATALGFIRSDENPATEAFIDSLVSQLATTIFSSKAFSLEDIESASLKVKKAEGVKMQVGSLVEDRATYFEEWLPQVKGDIQLNYWSDYKKYLAQKDGFSSQVLFTIDQQTDQILARCSDPNSREYSSRKGMVVGSVQSGKTSNYIGLITKAADYGYKVIIVIAGIPEDLRSQTQKRINEGFVGQDTSSMTTDGLIKTGVGKFREDTTVPPWSFTKEKFDFNAASANSSPVVLNSSLDEPVVFVIKKNDKILGNLLQWLSSSSCLDSIGKIDLPLLLIDDEADNASVNTKYLKDEASKINEKIRLILDCFTRSTYIGYTATPFANIFIDPESTDSMNRQDLFPRHFIVGLEPPSSYIGPQSIFLGESELCREILVETNDFHDSIPLKHKKDLEPSLPSSLIDALYCFLLSDAIKDLRGIFAGFNSSMLVNVSHLRDVHSKLKYLLTEELDSIKAGIRAFGSLDHKTHSNHVIRRLERCYHDYFASIEYSFEAIRLSLINTYRRADVIVVNSSRQTTDTLLTDDKTHRSLIVIGGFSLSRGLTLEGLTITYFLRSTAMYDTLLQMGRWFGYRPNYEDICRIWMTTEAVEWYSHISLADSELRNDLADLQRSRLSPLDFGLRVRSHPDTLLVTAKNKMGSSQEITAEIQLADRFIETIDIEAEPLVIESNLRATEHLIENMLSSSRDGLVSSELHHRTAYGYLFKGVSAGYVISFINSFNSLSLLTRDPRPVVNYIYNRQADELAHWDVFIPSPASNRAEYRVNDRVLVNLQRRTAIIKSPKDSNMGHYLSLSSRGKVSGRGIERIGLSPHTVQQLETQWLREHPDKTIKNVPDSIFRIRKRKPLLVLHFLDIKDTKDLSEKAPTVSDMVTAWSISFPPTDAPQQAVEYRVNTSWIKALDLSSEIYESDGDLDL